MNGDCPETGKARFATARAAHLVIQRAYWSRRTQKQPRRVYFCELCQGYHVTSHRKSSMRRERLHYLMRRMATLEPELPYRPK